METNEQLLLTKYAGHFNITFPEGKIHFSTKGHNQIKYLLDFIVFPAQTFDIILKQQKSSMVILECKHVEFF